MKKFILASALALTGCNVASDLTPESMANSRHLTKPVFDKVISDHPPSDNFATTREHNNILNDYLDESGVFHVHHKLSSSDYVADIGGFKVADIVIDQNIEASGAPKVTEEHIDIVHFIYGSKIMIPADEARNLEGKMATLYFTLQPSFYGFQERESKITPCAKEQVSIFNFKSHCQLLVDEAKVLVDGKTYPVEKKN